MHTLYILKTETTSTVLARQNISKSKLTETNREAKNTSKSKPRGGVRHQAVTTEPISYNTTTTMDDLDDDTGEGEIAVFYEGAEESKRFDLDADIEKDDTSTMSMNSLTNQTITLTDG